MKIRYLIIKALMKRQSKLPAATIRMTDFLSLLHLGPAASGSTSRAKNIRMTAIPA